MDYKLRKKASYLTPNFISKEMENLDRIKNTNMQKKCYIKILHCREKSQFVHERRLVRQENLYRWNCESRVIWNVKKKKISMDACSFQQFIVWRTKLKKKALVTFRQKFRAIKDRFECERTEYFSHICNNYAKQWSKQYTDRYGTNCYNNLQLVL